MLHEDHGEREDPLAELRNRLADGLARTRLSKTQLAHQAQLSRTTVHEALKADTSAPSAETIAAISRVLRLPTAELLDLRRRAAGETSPAPARQEGPGRPIGEWDPHDLEVHPAEMATAQASSGALLRWVLPGYVERAHDRILADVVQGALEGRSGMLILAGSSSTGKTRACWEAVQPLAAQGWRLWHPFDPTRAEAALASLDRVGPRTVVWLNEAQHYLGHSQAGERIAAALHTLLTRPDRGPVLILGTLWPDYVDQYMRLPLASAPDSHSLVRELLTGRTVTVPDAFDDEALRAGTILAQGGDRLLADALTRAQEHRRVIQDLAGAPALLRRYEIGTPAARALLEAAMDARRLGVGLHLPQAFLADAATDYLTDHDYDQLTEDWAEATFADLAHPVHGKQAPLRRANPRPVRRAPGVPAPVIASAPAGPVFRLADYLEQHGRTTRRRLCPPASFWYAAHTHLTHPDDLNNLATAAEDRHRLQWSHHLRLRAAGAGNAEALSRLAMRRANAGDRQGAETLAQRAAHAGETHALVNLAHMRKKAGDPQSADALYRRAADAGNTHALVDLAQMREEAGDRQGADVLYRRAADAGNTEALVHLMRERENAGDRQGAETFAQRASAFGLLHLAQMREGAGDRQGADVLYRRAADAGNTEALVHLMRERENAGDRQGAETLAQRAASNGNDLGLLHVAVMREEAGDQQGAESLIKRAFGDAEVLAHLAVTREEAGDRQGAETLAQRATDAGHPSIFADLAHMRQEAGDLQSAEVLARQAIDAGHPDALAELARMLHEVGDLQNAEVLAREAADAGDVLSLHYGTQIPLLEERWPHGLDPDGSPTPPWS
ncbi:helix-turn-helix domain-containing protein [Streptomyces sp. WAC 04229]|uniref:helix-turn-helix domain-containing protein n=1 Tax=Streptomyces sp. WAC 04229 TaxID=2203206 RepID=UPI003D74426A